MQSLLHLGARPCRPSMSLMILIGHVPPDPLVEHGPVCLRAQKVRSSIKQFYKRGRSVVAGLLKKHDFDTVFVFITSHYLSTLVCACSCLTLIPARSRWFLDRLFLLSVGLCLSR